MKNKIIELNDKQVNFLKNIKEQNHWSEAFWFERLQKEFDEIDTSVALNGNACLSWGCFSTLDEAIETKKIRLM